MSYPQGKERPNRIAVVVLDSDFEALLLRQSIEWMGEFEVPVDLIPVGRCAHLIAVLRGEATDAAHVVLCCHGDDEGIILPELHSSIAAEEPYTGHFGDQAIRREARLDSRVVLSTGCSTGALAPAFLAAGASAYIAPTGDPDGAAPFAFVAMFYYHLLSLGADLRTVFEAAQMVGGDTRMFGLFTSG